MSDGGSVDKAAASAAALAESQDGIRAQFRGLDLILPAKLPAVVTLDIAEMQSAEDNDAQQLGTLWRMLTAVIGAEQMRKIRNKVAEDGDTLEDVGGLLDEFMRLITEPYSLTPGESRASGTS